MRVRRTSKADADLSRIWHHVAQHRRAAADRLILKIDEVIRQVSQNPDLGIRCEEIRAGLFCKPVRRSYLIFYEVRGQELIVVRVLHSSRNHEDLL